ncbi:hypothetical protein [Pyxidicoccus sp. MSG2]|uniref:hypothetical protein n=1 Tax=Pyxidicoccus sp. MSG2 TaxID=2996790 RepID=UPI00226DE9F5|nr:hypothetical protein [Pyxidicoccus sp. MSG2]MCY1015497.1 hypothetical protein [Pyxidicoccus sp. MSG2]
MDSATAACQRNPAYCAALAGKEPGVSLAVRAAQVAAAGKAWEVLDELVRKSIEDILFECAKWADAEVNRKEFGGRAPNATECDQQVGGTRENPVTRGMRLGGAKHELASQCTEEKLSRAQPGRFTLEQRYRIHPETRQLELISLETELAMLRRGGKELVGSVVPDVVIHTGNPLQVQAVFDFKFPCPEGNRSAWRNQPSGNASGVSNQGKAYERTFGVQPTRVRPRKEFE